MFKKKEREFALEELDTLTHKGKEYLIGQALILKESELDHFARNAKKIKREYFVPVGWFGRTLKREIKEVYIYDQK